MGWSKEGENGMNDEQSYKERIYRKLAEAFQPILLEITDDSKHHIGHAGHHVKGETHFSIKIVSLAFEKKRTLERHRMVYAILEDELKEHVHALALETLSASEYSPPLPSFR